jgi:hypothetical protein
VDKRKLVYERGDTIGGNLKMDWRDFIYESEDRRENGHTTNCDCWVCDHRWQYRKMFYDCVKTKESDYLYRFTSHCEFQYREFLMNWTCTELSRAMCSAFAMDDEPSCACTIPF